MGDRIAVVLGTRPEIIKMAPVIKRMQERGVPFLLVHTGQHYSYNMDAVFFSQLGLPAPGVCLNAGSGSHGEQTAKMLPPLEKIFLAEKFSAVLVQGDTNTVLAASLAASKTSVRVGHVEAGLRSYDRSMPEEVNRVLSDRVAHYLFAPTPGARKNLLAEGIEKNVFVTGNTIVEALRENLASAEKISGNRVLERTGAESKKYMLATLHRQENVDRRERLAEVLAGIKSAGEKTGLPVFLPAHPRTVRKMEEFGLKESLAGVNVIEPMGYFEFLFLQKNAGLVLTDSGGLQEESCILGVPCVTLRENTERPETIEAGANVLAGWKRDSIVRAVEKMLGSKKRWEQPFGDGRAASRIIEAVLGCR